MDEIEKRRYLTDKAFEELRDLVEQAAARLDLTGHEQRVILGTLAGEAYNRGFSAGVVDPAAQAIEQGARVNIRRI